MPSGATNPSLAAYPTDAPVGAGVAVNMPALTAQEGSSTRPAEAEGSGMEAEIRGFLADIFFLGDDPASLPADRSLITAGVIDSTGVLELVGFLEDQYGIRIEDEELLPENLDTVENIVGFVTRKRGSA